MFKVLYSAKLPRTLASSSFCLRAAPFQLSGLLSNVGDERCRTPELFLGSCSALRKGGGEEEVSPPRN